jgi:cell division septation protein DedD
MVTTLSALLVALLSGLDPVAGVLEWAFAPALEPVERHEAQPVDLGDPVAVVQVELLPDLESAESLTAILERHLEARGHQFDVFLEVVPGDADLPASYRVNIGPFDSFEDAERAHGELDAIGIDGFVRELQPMDGC